LIPGLTDFEIVGFNVYEIAPKAVGSALAPNKSLYVIDVPDSERAPHQSRRDLKYYVRLGGKSRPASHRLIEDIRNRARHPKLEVQNLRIQNAIGLAPREPILELKSRFELRLMLACDLRNDGKVRASTSCLQISATVPLSMAFMNDPECFTRSATKGTVLIELKNPLYPGLGCPLGFPVSVSAELEVLQHGECLSLAGANPSDVRLFITTFADSAPAHQQEFKLTEIDLERSLARVIEDKVNEIRRAQRAQGGSPPRVGPWS
jgi:hypothetical protein